MSLGIIGVTSMINRGGNMEKVKQHAKKLWTLAVNNKKITAVVVIVVVILIIAQ